MDFCLLFLLAVISILCYMFSQVGETFKRNTTALVLRGISIVSAIIVVHEFGIYGRTTNGVIVIFLGAGAEALEEIPTCFIYYKEAFYNVLRMLNWESPAGV